MILGKVTGERVIRDKLEEDVGKLHDGGWGCVGVNGANPNSHWDLVLLRMFGRRAYYSVRTSYLSVRDNNDARSRLNFARSVPYNCLFLFFSAVLTGFPHAYIQESGKLFTEWSTSPEARGKTTQVRLADSGRVSRSTVFAMLCSPLYA